MEKQKLAKQVSEQVDVFVEELSRTEIMKKSLDNYGYILVADSMEDVIEIANENRKVYFPTSKYRYFCGYCKIDGKY